MQSELELLDLHIQHQLQEIFDGHLVLLASYSNLHTSLD